MGFKISKKHVTAMLKQLISEILKPLKTTPG